MIYYDRCPGIDWEFRTKKRMICQQRICVARIRWPRMWKITRKYKRKKNWSDVFAVFVSHTHRNQRNSLRATTYSIFLVCVLRCRQIDNNVCLSVAVALCMCEWAYETYGIHTVSIGMCRWAHERVRARVCVTARTIPMSIGIWRYTHKFICFVIVVETLAKYAAVSNFQQCCFCFSKYRLGDKFEAKF